MHHSSIRRAVSTNAYTLLELLVVVVIISILAALLLPALSRAKERARRVNCSSNLHQIGVAMESYADESNCSLPMGHWTMQSPPPGEATMTLANKGMAFFSANFR